MNNVRRFKVCSVSAILLAAVVLSPATSWSASSPESVAALKSWKQMQTRGEKAFDLNEYGNAERAFKQAVLKARSIGTPDLRFAKSSGELGRLLTIRGRFSEAEPYLEEEFKIKDELIGNDRGQMIPDMGTLIKFYLQYGTKTKAEPLTDSLLFFVEGRMRDVDHQSDARVRYKKGQPLQAWAGQAAPVAVDPLIEWAIACDELGNLYMGQGNLVLADRLFKAALDMKTTVLGKEHLSLANSYDSLGKVCMARNQYDDAETFFRDALSITEKIQPPGHPQIYSRVDKLARCLIKEGKMDEAEKLYLNANASLAKDPSDCGNESRALFALGCLYVDEKKFSQAEPVLEKALLSAQRFHGVDSVEIVPYLRKCAYVEYYLGRRGADEQLRARADHIAPIIVPMKATVKSLALEDLPDKPAVR
jgi:tetratricopeptide (TPR) repeat protein